MSESDTMTDVVVMGESDVTSDNNGHCSAMGAQSRCCSPTVLIAPRAYAEPHITETRREEDV